MSVEPAENLMVRRARWAELITAAWKQSFNDVIRIGQLLIRAKADLDHGEYEAMVETQLPFKIRTAQRLTAIANDERILKASELTLLPNERGTLYEMTRLSAEDFAACLGDGTINAEMDRSDIAQRVKAAARNKRERELGAEQIALPNQKFGIIVADPEWRFEPWSRKTGMDRAADNHYPTSCLEVIASRPVETISADDCVLFLWCTVPMMPQGVIVMGAWGFDYRSQFVWVKDKIGTGYWNRNQHELLLVGVRGNPPAPAPGTRESSVIDALTGEHSAKPEIVLDYIDGWYPTFPKIELNRRGPARKGWAAWGNESEPAAPSPAPNAAGASSRAEDATPASGLSAANKQSSGAGVSFWL